jgi:MFS family permease
VTTVVFGLSSSLPMAIVTRMVNGLANGNLGIAKSYLREITDETNQAKCAGVLSLAWGAGVIVGPLLGGLLSQPALKSPPYPPSPFRCQLLSLLNSFVQISVSLCTRRHLRRLSLPPSLYHCRFHRRHRVFVRFQVFRCVALSCSPRAASVTAASNLIRSRTYEIQAGPRAGFEGGGGCGDGRGQGEGGRAGGCGCVGGGACRRRAG